MGAAVENYCTLVEQPQPTWFLVDLGVDLPPGGVVLPAAADIPVEDLARIQPSVMAVAVAHILPLQFTM
jgi:hypothetical protein